MTTRRRTVALIAAALIAGLVVLSRCNSLPSLGTRTASRALTGTGDTRLGRAIESLAARHPGLSGVYPLRDARDAFAARSLLAAAAERSLDVQYYIWNKDLSGTLLFKALYDAAQRGVRVRLLLDDNNTSGLDTILAAMDAHPLIEIRLFNPFVIRGPRPIGYLTEFPRLNRRMHNKSFTADNQATIIGGRNVGDEYFGATDGVLFADLDVIAVGPVVQDTSRDFDRYWSSESAYPADRILPTIERTEITELESAAKSVASDPAAVAYMTAVERLPFVAEIVNGTLPLEWARVQMISDDPAKTLGRAAKPDLLFTQMQRIFGRPSSRVDLVSPYFVPGDFGERLFAGWARSGVEVRVLTNSREATDVPAVHAGYAKRREALLRAGVTLYELRLKPGAERARGSGPAGSSGSSLHAKTFAVDGARVFVGSFNFDPRSAELNTEMGFVIESPSMAAQMAATFDKIVPSNAYKVMLSEAGDIDWIETREGRSARHDTEPGTTMLGRLGVSLLSALPIEWLL